MAAEDKKNGNGGVCNCGCGTVSVYGRGGHWTFFLLRVLITVIILMVVFWFGLAVGRMSSYYARTGYMMRGGYPAGTMRGTGAAMPMMDMNGATSTQGAGGVQNY